MASLTIRNLDEPLEARLRLRAATNGRSMEAKARDILRPTLSVEVATPGNLGTAIRERFAP